MILLMIVMEVMERRKWDGVARQGDGRHIFDT